MRYNTTQAQLRMAERQEAVMDLIKDGQSFNGAKYRSGRGWMGGYKP